MPYTQLCDANWKIPYIGGWCEGFVEGAWGQASLPKQDSKGNWYTTGVYGSAIAKWNANPGNGNHPDELPPSGVTVPVYFSLDSVADGHTAISLDDGSVASSTQPGTHPLGFLHPNLQNLIDVYAKYNGGCTYLGWSEYVGTVRVVQPVTQPSQGGDMPAKINLDTARIMAHGVLARNGLSGRSNALDGSSDNDLTANHVGQDLTNEYVQGLFLSAEGRQWRDTQDSNSIQGINARLDQAPKLQDQLAAEQSKGVGLVQNVSDLTTQLAAANEEVKQAESIASDDAGKINALTVQLAEAKATIDQLSTADKPPSTKPTGTVVPPTSQATNPPLTPQKTSTWLTTVVAWLVSTFKRNKS
ncbi:hypothetical protein AB4Y95_00095 [Arthrobacter sp. M-10]|uniref:hypothetical protein n=1 Tax=Arthrobacter sp. M-10 TaxID=3233037 RepID=UPI003F92F86F